MHQEAHRAVRAVAAATLAALAAACQTAGRTDVTGTPMQVVDAGVLDPADTTFNVAAFFPPGVIAAIRRQVRDNMVPIDTYDLGIARGTGSITTQHVGGAYRWSDLHKVLDEDNFRAQAAQAGIAVREVTRVIHRNNHVGFRGVGRSDRGPADCVVASAGHDFIGSIGDFRPGSFDTHVTAYFCGTSVDAGMFDVMLSNLDLVRDRAAYRAALAARPAPVAQVTKASAPAGASPIAGRPPTRHTLRLTWNGRSGLYDDEVEITYRGEGGSLAFVHPDGAVECRVTFAYLALAAGQERGPWSGTCTDGATAAGQFRASGRRGEVTGSGTDGKGEKIEFMLSGSE